MDRFSSLSFSFWPSAEIVLLTIISVGGVMGGWLAGGMGGWLLR